MRILTADQKEARRVYLRQYRRNPENKVKAAAASARWARTPSGKAATLARVVRYLKTEKGKAARKAYAVTPKGRETARKASLSWLKNNPSAHAAHQAHRRASKKSATPKWANIVQIKAIYKEAAGGGMHVDHIVPLVHPMVCGLHVENNLQLLTPADNIRKHNNWPWVGR